MAYTDIDNSQLNFQVKTWTGTGSSNALTLDGAENMQPDYVMIKQRSGSQQWNGYDVIRGVQEYLGWNTAIQENTQSAGLTAFGSNGFTVGSDDMVNGSSSTYAGYCWKAGGSPSSNTDGSITSSVSVNTTAGISIGTYSANATSGATVGHGLGVAPDWLIVKVRNSSNNWVVYHKSMGETKAMYLDGSSGETSDGWMNNTAPTSSVFSLSGGNYGNASGYNLVFYAFAEKKGFSKFGQYTGNGDSDGTFVYTGFKPAWVLIKNTTGDNWTLLDNKRNTNNPESTRFLVNVDFAEASSETLDFLSNGFKCRRSDGAENGNGTKYIYMAFAENPLVTSTGIPTTAR